MSYNPPSHNQRMHNLSLMTLIYQRNHKRISDKGDLMNMTRLHPTYFISPNVPRFF